MNGSTGWMIRGRGGWLGSGRNGWAGAGYHILQCISNRVLRKEFPHLKEWCGNHHQWAPSCYYDSVGAGRELDEKYIQAHNIYEYNRGKYGKIAIYRPGTFVRGITVTTGWRIHAR
jgi:hypothetical protein